ncbi:MAG: DUF1573 domain-containing protein [Candidatus Omnitrophica bacterium]|nr:DUF1573 domain-containing protein [Candidatus Omnitrophota bacterium]MCB9781747.1 DUF1573 domain-containing protein [Candidatus Omnitrophota bacterium]MCB9785004.1 DUF1573 domain-containing protein [Candidatus Omnitrophota bacterium]
MLSIKNCLKISVCGFILLLGGLAYSGEDDIQPVSDAPAQSAATSEASLARMTVIDGEHDFGVIREGEIEKVDYTFKFKNTGQENLKILKVKPSCGCTKAEPSSKDLAPGEEATLVAEMKLKGKSGASTVSVTVDTNDPTQPTQVFRLKGTILTPMRIIPALMDFGGVGHDETKSRSLNVTSQVLDGDPIVKILKLFADSPQVQAVTREETTRVVNKGDETYREITRPVEVTVTGGDEMGQKDAKLFIVTDSVNEPTQTVQVRWKLEGDIEKQPSKVYVSKIKDRTIDRALTLRSRTGKEFHVSGIKTLIEKGTGDFIDVEPVSDSSADTKKYMIRIKDDGVERSRETCQGEIVFETDHPEMKMVKVPFVAVFR